jgi:predicted acetyltransferase
LANHLNLNNLFLHFKEEHKQQAENKSLILQAMNNQIDDSIKNQEAALLRVINVAGFFKGDDVPCQIEEVS